MKVLVDVTTWVPGRTGIGLYTERLLQAMQALGTNDELLLATNTTAADVNIAGKLISPKMPLRALWMQSAVPALCLQHRPDVAFYPNYMAPMISPCPSVITVHDMAVFLHPETFTWKKRVLQRALLPAILKQADAIVTPSRSTRRDLLRLVELDPRRVVPIHLAADPRLSDPMTDAEITAASDQLQLPPKYLLAVSTLEPRKNLVRLIAAFERVAPARPDVHLVLVGGKGWRDAGIRAALEKSTVADRIVTTGYVSFDALRLVYQRALALCYPSLYEGFGLPVVEAMACGTPVLTSTGSSLDEVAAGAAIAVDPMSVDEIAEGMRRLCDSPDLRAELSAKGSARAAQLSWSRTARLTREVLQYVANGKLPRVEDDA